MEDDKRGTGSRESDLGQVQSEMPMKYVSGGIKIGSNLEFLIKIWESSAHTWYLKS